MQRTVWVSVEVLGYRLEVANWEGGGRELTSEGNTRRSLDVLSLSGTSGRPTVTSDIRTTDNRAHTSELLDVYATAEGKGELWTDC